MPPTNRQEFVDTLTQSLRPLFVLPADRPMVLAEGENYPRFDRLVIDVSDAQINRAYRPARKLGQEMPGVSAAQFSIVGRGIRYETARLNLDVSATEAELVFDQDADGRLLLLPAHAQDGRLLLQITQADLESLLYAVARDVAQPNGVTIEKIELKLTCPGERTVLLDVRVTAGKKMGPFPVRVVVRGSGQLTLDEALNARISGLACQGEGTAGKIVAALVQGYLKQWEGRVFALGQSFLGSLRLHDVRIRCDAGIEIEGQFAG